MPEPVSRTSILADPASSTAVTDDLTARWSVAQGVIDKIEQHLLDLPGVAHYRERGSALLRETHPTGFTKSYHLVDRRAYSRANVHPHATRGGHRLIARRIQA